MSSLNLHRFVKQSFISWMMHSGVTRRGLVRDFRPLSNSNAPLRQQRHHHLVPPRIIRHCTPQILTRGSILTWRRLSSTSLGSGAGDFQPANPPGTHGTPVFDDIDFTVAQSLSAESAKRNSDPEAVFVVTGASRGIGLQFVKSLLERTQGTVVACCRDPENATNLIDLQTGDSSNGATRLQLLRLDLENQESIEEAGRTLRGQCDRVDLLLNVAGLLGDGKTVPGPERTIARMDRSWMEKTMAVNVIGPVMFSKEVIPLMMSKQRRRKHKEGDFSSALLRPSAVVVNLSARVGSISDNGLGGWYSYRMSKSALNQATRTMALELKRHSAWAVALHPGTTNTDLSKPFQANVKEGSLFPVEFTVHKLLNVVDALEEKHSGGFYDWAGQSLSF